MDDLIILASNVTQLKWLKSELGKEFGIIDSGEMHYCLGEEFEKNKEAHIITINQMSYIEEVLKYFNMEKYKLVGPMFNVNSQLLNFGMRNL